MVHVTYDTLIVRLPLHRPLLVIISRKSPLQILLPLEIRGDVNDRPDDKCQHPPDIDGDWFRINGGRRETRMSDLEELRD